MVGVRLIMFNQMNTGLCHNKVDQILQNQANKRKI